MTEGLNAEEDAGKMNRRQAVLEDGRYLIYYTFGEGGKNVREGVSETAAPVAEDEAVEERSV